MSESSASSYRRGFGAGVLVTSIVGAVIFGPQVKADIDASRSSPSTASAEGNNYNPVSAAPKIPTKTLREITGKPVSKPTVEAVAASVVRIAVTRRNKNDEYIACSGFVLNNFLVTAGHCLSEANIINVDVYTPGQDKPVDTVKAWDIASDADVALGTFTQPWPEASISAPDLPTGYPTFGQQLTETGIPGGQHYYDGTPIPLGHERSFTGSLVYVGQQSHPNDFVLSPANSPRVNAELDIGGASGSPIIGDFKDGFSVAVLDTETTDMGSISNLEHQDNLSQDSPIHTIVGATVLTADLYSSMANQLR